MTLRRALFWCHLSLGVLTAVFVGFMAITGILLSFQGQIVAAADSSVERQVVETTTCETLGSVLARIRQETGKDAISATLFRDEKRPLLFTVSSSEVYLANPCNGALLQGSPSGLRKFYAQVKDLHRWVAYAGQSHPALRALKNIATLLFLFLLLSGVVLWFPRRWGWSRVRSVAVPNLEFKGRAREWNFHNAAGVWCWLPLLLIAATGIVMAYSWANTLLFHVAHSPVPAEKEQAAKADLVKQYGWIDVMIPAVTEADSAWQGMTVRIPRLNEKNVSFTLENNESALPQARVQLLVSRKGTVVRSENFASWSRGKRWRQNARYLHTGEIFGVSGQLVVTASVCGLLVLLWTGVSLSIRRLLLWRRRKYMQSEISLLNPV